MKGFMESYRYWSRTSRDPLFWDANWGEQRPFPFPDNQYNKKGGVCTVCHGDGWVDGYDTMCICSVSEWLTRRESAALDYESTLQPAMFDQIKFPTKDAYLKAGWRDMYRLLKIMPEWVMQPKAWYFIPGPPGSGKTHILRAIRTALPAALYITATDFQGFTHSTLSNNDFENFRDTLQSAPILLFDDWGLEHDTKWDIDVFAAIIDYRCRDPFEFPTIVTTNFASPQKSPDVRTSRIASRLLDESYCNLVPLFGIEDHRIPESMR